MKKQNTAHQHDIVARQDATKICVLTIDQRTAERLPLTLTLAYTIRLPNEEITGRTKTITVSGTGVEFPTTQMIPVASPCQITLTLPNQPDPLILTGRIGWCRQRQGIRNSNRGYAVGIAFSVSSNEVTFAQYCHFIAAELLKRYLQ